MVSGYSGSLTGREISGTLGWVGLPLTTPWVDHEGKLLAAQSHHLAKRLALLPARAAFMVSTACSNFPFTRSTFSFTFPTT